MASDRYVVLILARVGTQTVGPDPSGLYVRSYDPDAHDGGGFVDGTDDVELAATFDSPRKVLEFVRQVSKTRPRRPDGQPNRPITAYTLEIVKRGA